MKYECILKEDNKKISHIKSNSLKDVLHEVERKFDDYILKKKI